MATNSPWLMERLMPPADPPRTWVRLDLGPKPLTRSRTSRNAMGDLLQGRGVGGARGEEATKHGGKGEDGEDVLFDEVHHAVEKKADDADGDDAEDDVGIVGCLIFLPEEAPDAGTAREHFDGDNHEPGKAQR